MDFWYVTWCIRYNFNVIILMLAGKGVIRASNIVFRGCDEVNRT